jgi:hypothetical protein
VLFGYSKSKGPVFARSTDLARGRRTGFFRRLGKTYGPYHPFDILALSFLFCRKKYLLGAHSARALAPFRPLSKMFAGKFSSAGSSRTSLQLSTVISSSRTPSKSLFSRSLTRRTSAWDRRRSKSALGGCCIGVGKKRSTCQRFPTFYCGEQSYRSLCGLALSKKRDVRLKAKPNLFPFPSRNHPNARWVFGKAIDS